MTVDEIRGLEQLPFLHLKKYFFYFHNIQVPYHYERRKWKKYHEYSVKHMPEFTVPIDFFRLGLLNIFSSLFCYKLIPVTTNL